MGTFLGMNYVPGTWGIGGFRLPDFGATELKNVSTGGNTSNSTWNNPAVYKAVGGVPNSQNVQPLTNTYRNLGVLPQNSNLNYSSGGGGNTLGVSTQQNGGNPGGNVGSPDQNPETTYVDVPGRGSVKLADLQREAAAREAQIRSNIESGFGQYDTKLTELENMYPTMQAADEKLAGDTYNSMFSGIQEGQTLANQKLDLSKQNVLSTGKNSISDLSANLRNMLKASSSQLGAMGAGSSSAAPMAAYAYSKIAAHERGGIQKQINDQLMQIDQKAVDVQTTFNSQKMELEQWKGTQLQGIRDKYLPMVTRIKEMKANAPLQKVQALNNLEESLLTRAQNELSQIETEGRQYAMTVQTNAQTQLANLTALKLQLANNANFDPQSIVFKQMNAFSTPQNSDNYNYTNPMSMGVAKKKNPWEA